MTTVYMKDLMKIVSKFLEKIIFIKEWNNKIDYIINKNLYYEYNKLHNYKYDKYDDFFMNKILIIDSLFHPTNIYHHFMDNYMVWRHFFRNSL